MRPTRHQMFLAMARAAATRATCYRLNVGAVLVDSMNQNVIGVGYNGAPSGQPHCTGNACQYFSSTGCRVVHAEINALSRATETSLANLYVTHSPCQACAERIRDNARPRILGVYFETPYRDPTPIQTLLKERVEVFQVLPSGLMVNQKNGELCEP